MKRLVALVALVATLAAPAAALAYTPHQVAQQTITTFNTKLKFSGSTYRIATVRCLKETPTWFYCRGVATSTNPSYDPLHVSWDATIAANGYITWKAESGTG